MIYYIFIFQNQPPVCSPVSCPLFYMPVFKIQVTRQEEVGVNSHPHHTRRPILHPTSEYPGISHLILRSNQNNIPNRFQPASQVYYEKFIYSTGLGTFDGNYSRLSLIMSQLSQSNQHLTSLGYQGWGVGQGLIIYKKKTKYKILALYRLQNRR